VQRRDSRLDSEDINLNVDNKNAAKSSSATILKLKTIREAADAVVGALVADEFQRTAILLEEESEKSYTYTYSIRRREDLKNFIDNLIEKEAEASGISKSAIVLELDEELGGFEIPPGFAQRVVVDVPKDGDLNLRYSAFNIKISDALNLDGTFTTFGEVTAGEEDRNGRWRYGHLLDVAPVGE
jgi:hypothetical protein